MLTIRNSAWCETPLNSVVGRVSHPVADDARRDVRSAPSKELIGETDGRARAVPPPPRPSDAHDAKIGNFERDERDEEEGREMR